jgi:hypothetical protein
MKLSDAIADDVRACRAAGYVLNRSAVCYEMKRRSGMRWRRYVRECVDCPIRFGRGAGCFDALEAMAKGGSAATFDNVVARLKAKGD